MTTDEQKSFADVVVWRALALMQDEGIPFAVMMDRVLTAAGAHITFHDGADKTAEAFRRFADNIAAGCFDAIEARHAKTAH